MDTFNYWNFTVLYSLGEHMDVVRSNVSGNMFVRRVSPADMLPVMQELTSVNNCHVMRIFDCRMERGACVSISEFINGTTLEELVKTNGPFDEAKAKQIISDVCDGLSAIHLRGIIHRDINPSNVMIDSSGNVRIIDFDITRKQRTDAAHDTHVLGTVGYAAPEQFGFAQSDEKTDIYSCGVLLNYIYTGWLPGEHLASGSVGRIVAKCIKIDKTERFKNVEDLKNALAKRCYRPESRFLPLPGFTKHPVLTSVFFVLYFIALISGIMSIVSSAASGSSMLSYNIVRVIVVFVFWSALPYVFFGNLGHISELIDKGDSKRAGTILKLLGIGSFIAGWLVMFIYNNIF